MQTKQPNQLITQTSPYLLQHAYNPVQWYPWGEEALEKARVEDKPILLSIGYAACHWCHVMERESFEDEATAELMNAHFVNIKVDREERPDIDHIYMDAVQAITGSGGWPLNVFLTPDKKPFYGGTYFPPEDRYNRMGWKNVLTAIHHSFLQKRNEIEEQANNLHLHLKNASNWGIGKPSNNNFFFELSSLLQVEANLLKQADTVWGGFGKAPKFPQTFSIQFLLRHYHFTKSQAALNQALLSLDKMIEGGIYDQIGGGFARYSTDNEWLAPHFEKMLYDNALILSNLAEAYQITKKDRYKKVIEQTIDFLIREMRCPEGGFYSAIDADSEGEEGLFYVWNKQEIEALFDAEDAQICCKYFQVTNDGNWEGINILHVRESPAAIAAYFGLSEQALQDKIDQLSARLFQHRSGRVRPATDDKILLGWNALMITALAKCYASTGNALYKQLATATLGFLQTQMSKTENEQSHYYHTYKNGTSNILAFLDDYAYLIQACIAVAEITGDIHLFKEAQKLTEYVISYFDDEDASFFYYTNHQQNDVIIRKKEVYDGAIPSGNSTMAYNLFYLSFVFNKNDWQQRAVNMVSSLGNTIVHYPTSFGNWAMVLQLMIEGIKELVIMNGTEKQVDILKLLNVYLPNKILIMSNEELTAIQATHNRLVSNKAMYYLCKNQVCTTPVEGIQQFLTFITA